MKEIRNSETGVNRFDLTVYESRTDASAMPVRLEAVSFLLHVLINWYMFNIRTVVDSIEVGNESKSNVNNNER